MNIFYLLSQKKAMKDLNQLLYNNKYENIFICLFIMKAKPTERKCKDWELIIPYIPRIIRCSDTDASAAGPVQVRLSRARRTASCEVGWLRASSSGWPPWAVGVGAPGAHRPAATEYGLPVQPAQARRARDGLTRNRRAGGVAAAGLMSQAT
jgi:hypothetical protein